MVLDDLVGGVVGDRLGVAIRRGYLRRKMRRVRDGRSVRVRASAELAGVARRRIGRVKRSRSGVVTWQSLLGFRRRDLAGATVVAGSVSDSWLWGRRCTLELAGRRGVDRLVVSSDREPVVSALLGDSGSAGRDDGLERLGRISRRTG